MAKLKLKLKNKSKRKSHWRGHCSKNKHPTGCQAQLAWKCLFTLIMCRRATLTGKVGHTDLVFGLVFGVWWGCNSRSVHARLQVCVCRGYGLCHHSCLKIRFLHLTPVTPENWSNQKWICQLIHPCQMHLGDHRSVTCRDNAHISCFTMTYKPHKVGQVDLGFGFWSGFVCRPVHARLQVSVYTYDLCHPG